MAPARRARPQQSRSRGRSRSHFIHGRLHVPFAGYQRHPFVGDPDDAADNGRYPIAMFGARHGLTPEEARQAQELLERAEQERGRLEGPKLAARIAGIVSAVKGGRAGNSTWGWRMHGKRGGQAMARHATLKLREISAAGVRASLIARKRRKALVERSLGKRREDHEHKRRQPLMTTQTA